MDSWFVVRRPNPDGRAAELPKKGITRVEIEQNIELWVENMGERFAAFTAFVASFLYYLWMVREVLTGLLLLLLLGGVLISKIEGLSLVEAIYFAFITGLSIGYGDITPQTGLGKCISVAIGLIGMVSMGITVAVATRALADTTRQRLQSKEDHSVGSRDDRRSL